MSGDLFKVAGAGSRVCPLRQLNPALMGFRDVRPQTVEEQRGSFKSWGGVPRVMKSRNLQGLRTTPETHGTPPGPVARHRQEYWKLLSVPWRHPLSAGGGLK